MTCAKCPSPATHPLNLCAWHHGRLTSVLTQCGRVNGEPLDELQRRAIMGWFLATRHFSSHRRLSRGLAKKLMAFIDKGLASIQSTSRGPELNPANVSPRGPHDLVVDGASQGSDVSLAPTSS